MDAKEVLNIYERISFIHKREENSAIQNNMGRLWGCYANWNKLGRERQILYDLTYMWNLREKKNSYIE